MRLFLGLSYQLNVVLLQKHTLINSNNLTVLFPQKELMHECTRSRTNCFNKNHPSWTRNLICFPHRYLMCFEDPKNKKTRFVCFSLKCVHSNPSHIRPALGLFLVSFSSFTSSLTHRGRIRNDHRFAVVSWSSRSSIKTLISTKKSMPAHNFSVKKMLHLKIKKPRFRDPFFSHANLLVHTVVHIPEIYLQETGPQSTKWRLDE